MGLCCMLFESKLTTHLEKISNPEWNQLYAFSKILFRLRWVWLCMEAKNLGLSFVFFVFGFKVKENLVECLCFVNFYGYIFLFCKSE